MEDQFRMMQLRGVSLRNAKGVLRKGARQSRSGYVNILFYAPEKFLPPGVEDMAMGRCAPMLMVDAWTDGRVENGALVVLACVCMDGPCREEEVRIPLGVIQGPVIVAYIERVA